MPLEPCETLSASPSRERKSRKIASFFPPHCDPSASKRGSRNPEGNERIVNWLLRNFQASVNPPLYCLEKLWVAVRTDSHWFVAPPNHWTLKHSPWGLQGLFYVCWLMRSEVKFSHKFPHRCKLYLRRNSLKSNRYTTYQIDTSTTHFVTAVAGKIEQGEVRTGQRTPLPGFFGRLSETEL